MGFHQNPFKQHRKSETVTLWRGCAIQCQQHEKDWSCAFLQDINLTGSHHNYQSRQPVLGSLWVISKVNTHSSVMAQNGVSPWVWCTVIMVFTSWSTLAVFSSLFFVVIGLANHNLSSISSLPVSDWPRIWVCDTRVILTGIDNLQMPISFHLSC